MSEQVRMGPGNASCFEDFGQGLLVVGDRAFRLGGAVPGSTNASLYRDGTESFENVGREGTEHVDTSLGGPEEQPVAPHSIALQRDHVANTQRSVQQHKNHSFQQDAAALLGNGVPGRAPIERIGTGLQKSFDYNKGGNVMDFLNEQEREIASNREAIEKICRSMTDIVIKDKFSLNVMLGGVLAFLMALSASGHGDNEFAGRELRKMSDYSLNTERPN